MKHYFFNVLFLLLFTTNFLVAQNNYTKHTVAKGETLFQIAEHYNVSLEDIYKVNPDAQKGIQTDSILLIPTQKKGSTRVHEVQPKETKYSIAKQYDIEIEALERANPFINAEGLQPGQKLDIPFSNTLNEVKNGKGPLYHEVQEKETKYGIAKQYGISIEELEKQNPEIKDNLTVGSQLVINKSIDSNSKTTNNAPKEVDKTKSDRYLEYKVKQGETLYSLSKLLEVSKEELLDYNPEIKEGIKEGMVLKLPTYNRFLPSKTKKELLDLTKNIQPNTKKTLVMLLPFNVSKIESDTVNTIASRLKKDKFLNMTLDFYSGALMAIDSAKVLGLNFDISIFDSQETKTSSGAVSIVANKINDTDAIIGPFYQTNVEKVASMLESKNIPVISPLSKDYDQSYTNLYQSMPSSESLKEVMFNFMKAKNGNIIAVVDPKKNSIKQYITEKQKGVKLVGLSEKGAFVADSIKKHFVKDKINYVVMESEKTGTIFTTTNTMIVAMKDYMVQLVILEPNETLDFEEISLNRLTKLKMMYPSVIRENETVAFKYFQRNYKKKNKILPNQYAIRGFDVTFDTLLRLSKDISFQESTQTVVTEQTLHKFDYTKTTEGYINKGVYIMFYDTDLTIKQVN